MGKSYDLAKKENLDIDLYEAGYSESCPVCNHPICTKVIEVYFEKKKDILKTFKWVNDFYKEEIFNKNDFVNHLENHIEPYVTYPEFLRKKKVKNLEREVARSKKNNKTRLDMIKQIVWECMIDVYANKKSELKTEKDKNDHQRMTKQINDLAKTYKDYIQMDFEIIGMGKTEEEQKEAMQNYVSGMLRQAIQILEGDAEAQEKLSDFLDMHVNKR